MAILTGYRPDFFPPIDSRKIKADVCDTAREVDARDNWSKFLDSCETWITAGCVERSRTRVSTSNNRKTAVHCRNPPVSGDRSIHFLGNTGVRLYSSFVEVQGNVVDLDFTYERDQMDKPDSQ